jgi:DNA polymerase III delta prime subunit
VASWLSTHAPRTFDDLAVPTNIRESLRSASLSPEPPHLLITGPAGVGKTASWRLVARQMLGPGWKSTTHILQARDLLRTRGAMAKFEEFLRPSGAGSTDTLAGRMSLDAYDRGIISASEGDVAPAGAELEIEPGRIPVSRLLVIEDADHLGGIRQAYLRRMMETVGVASRFILVARAPSRLIDAIRSRTQMIRIPSTDREAVITTMQSIAKSEKFSVDEGVLGDLAYVAEGNLRKALFTLEMLNARDLTDDRSAVHRLVQATTLQAGRHLLELALRGRVVEWRWENVRGRRSKVLGGAIAEIDRLMNDHGLDADDIISQLHDVLVGRRLSLPDELRSELLSALAVCDTQIRSTMHARIPFENFLHKAATSGRKHGLAFG